MTRTSTAEWPCTIARTVDLLGEGWTLLVMRQAFFGVRRFEEFQRSLGIARNMLALRLERLVETGLFTRVAYQERPVRYECRLTEKGRDVFPILMAMAAYGERWLTGDNGTPLEFEHANCGHVAHAVVVCDVCSERIDVREVSARPGPGFPGTTF